MVKLTSPKFVLHMVIYQDLLADLAELSLDFQSDQLSLSSVRMKIMATQAALEKQREKPGLYLHPLLTAFNNTDLFQYKGVEIRNANVSAQVMSDREGALWITLSHASARGFPPSQPILSFSLLRYLIQPTYPVKNYWKNLVMLSCISSVSLFCGTGAN